MKHFTVLMAMAALFAFGTTTLPTYAADPAPAPSDGKDKKNPSGPKLFENEKKDEKKDEKGGK